MPEYKIQSSMEHRSVPSSKPTMCTRTLPETELKIKNETVEIETAEYCSPDDAMIIGKVVSMEVTPPDEIGARGPKLWPGQATGAK